MQIVTNDSVFFGWLFFSRLFLRLLHVVVIIVIAVFLALVLFFPLVAEMWRNPNLQIQFNMRIVSGVAPRARKSVPTFDRCAHSLPKYIVPKFETISSPITLPLSLTPPRFSVNLPFAVSSLSLPYHTFQSTSVHIFMEECESELCHLPYPFRSFSTQ